MPHKTWVHNCRKHEGAAIWKDVETCPDCGQRGRYDGWQLSVIESLGAQQMRTGFRLMGPHSDMVSELLGARMTICEQCMGRGVIGTDRGEGFEICPSRHMAGYFFDGTPGEFQAIRKSIKTAFPEADVNSPLTPETTPKANIEAGFMQPKPGDRSLQAYKDWVQGMLAIIKPNSGDTVPWTDEEWELHWKEFWSKLDNAEADGNKDEV